MSFVDHMVQVLSNYNNCVDSYVHLLDVHIKTMSHYYRMTSRIRSTIVSHWLNAMSDSRTSSSLWRRIWHTPEMRLERQQWTGFTKRMSGKVATSTRHWGRSGRATRSDEWISSKICKKESLWKGKKKHLQVIFSLSQPSLMKRNCEHFLFWQNKRS